MPRHSQAGGALERRARPRAAASRRTVPALEAARNGSGCTFGAPGLLAADKPLASVEGGVGSSLNARSDSPGSGLSFVTVGTKQEPADGTGTPIPTSVSLPTPRPTSFPTFVGRNPSLPPLFSALQPGLILFSPAPLSASFPFFFFLLSLSPSRVGEYISLNLTPVSFLFWIEIPFLIV